MSDTSTPRIGQVFADRYQLLEELGRGGFGVIYRARQSAPPHDVAIKILYPVGPSGDDHEFAQRFEREALMAKSIQHPHTVTQYDYGKTNSGYFYIVMELLRGQTMTERIKTHGPMPPHLIINIARAVLQVLELAHQQGIVHRDIKPENIMLCRIGAYHDVPKLLDFGAAKTTQGDHDITSAGITLGSPAYMAPEILQGNPPLPVSDLYSLGLTLCEAILGHKLVPGDDALARARTQLHPDPLPIPQTLARHPLYPWLARAIQKPTAHRYASAKQMRQALDHLALSLQRGQPNRLPPHEQNLQESTDPLISPPPTLDAAARRLATAEDDDFDADPTEFLHNPYRGEEQPSATAPPHQPHTPQTEQWSPNFTSRRRRPTAAHDEHRPSSKVIIEPSFESDYQTIKTYDKIKEGHTVRVIAAGLIILLIIILALYGSAP